MITIGAIAEPADTVAGAEREEERDNEGEENEGIGECEVSEASIAVMPAAAPPLSLCSYELSKLAKESTNGTLPLADCDAGAESETDVATDEETDEE